MTEDEYRNQNHTITLFDMAFGTIEIKSGKVSPVSLDRMTMIGQTQIEDLAAELFKKGFKLRQITVEKEICPTCKRPL